MVAGDNEFKPQARTSGLVVRDVGGEVLIFDRRNDKAFCLDYIAGQVWKLSDGGTSVTSMTRSLRDSTGAAVADDTVYAAIRQLHRDGLLQESTTVTRNVMSRRDLMQRAGLAAAVAIPVITSLTVPTAAFAGSKPSACLSTV